MMGIAVPETCWSYRNYNKTYLTSSWFLFLSYHNDARSYTHQTHMCIIFIYLIQIDAKRLGNLIDIEQV